MGALPDATIFQGNCEETAQWKQPLPNIAQRNVCNSARGSNSPTQQQEGNTICDARVVHISTSTPLDGSVIFLCIANEPEGIRYVIPNIDSSVLYMYSSLFYLVYSCLLFCLSVSLLVHQCLYLGQLHISFCFCELQPKCQRFYPFPKKRFHPPCIIHKADVNRRKV